MEEKINDKNKMISKTFGILSFLLAIISIMLLVFFPKTCLILAIVSIIFGVISNRGFMATAGKVLGIIATVISFVLVCAYMDIDLPQKQKPNNNVSEEKKYPKWMDRAANFLIEEFIELLMPEKESFDAIKYLESKYGKEEKFEKTGVGGGGIGINHHIRYVTSEKLKDNKEYNREFEVIYYRDDEGKIYDVSDTYMSKLYSDDVEREITLLIKEIINEDFSIVAEFNYYHSGEKSLSFEEFVQEADLYCEILVDSDYGYIDKQKITDKIIEKLQQAGYINNLDNDRIFMRIAFLEDGYNLREVIANDDIQVRCKESFSIRKNGFEDSTHVPWTGIFK